MTTSKSLTEGAGASTPAPRWATLVATFFGAGRLRPGPGTWGSLAAVLLWWLLIDEVAGQLVTLIASPILWKPLLAGFILFRAIDIVKPPPIRSLEKLPEGTGIVVDDLGAGIYGLVVLQLLLHFHLLS
jgi:phosphatidylglycerophosphatase A